jgi:hypothetical protein
VPVSGTEVIRCPFGVKLSATCQVENLMPSAAVRIQCYRLTVEILSHQISVTTLRNRTRLMRLDALKTKSYQLPLKILYPQQQYTVWNLMSRRYQHLVEILISSAAWTSGFYVIRLSFKALRIRRYQQLVRLISSASWVSGFYVMSYLPRLSGFEVFNSLSRFDVFNCLPRLEFTSCLWSECMSESEHFFSSV